MSNNLRHAIAYEKLLAEKEALERRLAEAEEDAEKWRKIQRTPVGIVSSPEGFMLVNEEAWGEMEFHLRAASELPKKWRGTQQGYSVILGEHHQIYNTCFECADELEAALRGEADGP